jgi:hypothetical protein
VNGIKEKNLAEPQRVIRAALLLDLCDVAARARSGVADRE